MDSGKIDRGLVRRDWSAKITERIEDRLASEDSTRLKDRIVLIQDAVESRGGHLRPGNRILELAVTEPGVVPPGPVKEPVPLDADGAHPRVVFVFEKTVSKLSQTRAGAARDNLLEGIKRIERVSRETGLRVGGCVGWLRAWRNWGMRGNGQCGLTKGLE